MENSNNFKKLVEEVKKGDTEAFGQIYDLLVDRVYRYIFFRVSSKEETEDLTEEVFLKVYKNIENYENNHQIPFEAWLFRIARNHLTDYYRTKKQVFPIEEAIDIKDSKEGPEEQTIKNIQLEEVLGSLKNIPSSYQDIIILKFIEDKKNEEISNILDKPVDQIRVLQSRALKALKREIECNNYAKIQT